MTIESGYSADKVAENRVRRAPPSARDSMCARPAAVTRGRSTTGGGNW
jgi:hypothetical protein